MTKIKRKSENDKFANDGSFESVELLLRKLAAQNYRRAVSVGMSVTIDDVYQEMCVSYIQARAKWDESNGARFSTYLTSACTYNFSSQIRTHMTRQKSLRIESIQALASSYMDGNEDALGEMSWAGDNGIESPNFFRAYRDGESTIPGGHSPMEIIERLQEALLLHQESARKLKKMSIEAQSALTRLVEAHNADEDGTAPIPSIGAIMRGHGWDIRQCARVRSEIKRQFGV